jgi:hypothetical protein
MSKPTEKVLATAMVFRALSEELPSGIAGDVRCWPALLAAAVEIAMRTDTRGIGAAPPLEPAIPEDDLSTGDHFAYPETTD